VGIVGLKALCTVGGDAVECHGFVGLQETVGIVGLKALCTVGGDAVECHGFVGLQETGDCRVEGSVYRRLGCC